jgi:hypothetical protein
MKKQCNSQDLSSECDCKSKINEQKMLREILNDDITPKKHDFRIQNELHTKIRNDKDYDDWEYGTEPLYELNNWNK